MTVMEHIRANLPIHYASCLTVAFRSRTCDCTATADVTALLDTVAVLDRTLAEIAGPDDDDGT